MSDCRKCAEFDWCVENEDCGLFKLKPMTNADRIRSMTDEELANMWCTYVDCGECPKRIGCSMNYQDCLKLALDYLKDVVQSDGA